LSEFKQTIFLVLQKQYLCQRKEEKADKSALLLPCISGGETSEHRKAYKMDLWAFLA